METTIQLTVNPQEFGLEVIKAEEIQNAFTPKIIEREALYQIYSQLITQEITVESCKEAGDLRKKLAKVRTAISDVHKTEKAYSLAYGRYVDALKNKNTLPIEQMEEKLSEMEKFFENIERERILQLKSDRAALLSKYTEPSLFQLGEMSQEAFDQLLNGQKLAFEAKVEADKKAEAERVEAERIDKAEREQIRIDNERLKLEALTKDKRNLELRPFVVFIRDYNKLISLPENEYLKEFEEIKKGADLQWEFERKEAIRKDEEADARERELQAERDAREKLESENKARIESEAKERKRIEAENKKAAAAPDRVKLILWINSMNAGLVEISDPELSAIGADILNKFNSFKVWALKQLEEKK